jgi:hypothetical protein
MIETFRVYIKRKINAIDLHRTGGSSEYPGAIPVQHFIPKK